MQNFSCILDKKDLFYVSEVNTFNLLTVNNIVQMHWFTEKVLQLKSSKRI